jgi:hypothetical protein
MNIDFSAADSTLIVLPDHQGRNGLLTCLRRCRFQQDNLCHKSWSFLSWGGQKRGLVAQQIDTTECRGDR